MAEPQPQAGVVDELLQEGSTLIMLGTGGVGKTTVAAAIGVAAARRHLRTAVITVDPARRLRDALGLVRLGGKPQRLGARRLSAAGLDPQLELWAMMLDAKGAWDSVIERFTADPEQRRQILENPFYRQLTEQFAGSEAYAALEQLYDLHTAGEFGFTVVDTPPAVQAIEFIDAPARLTRMLDSGPARWFFTPYLSASRFAIRMAGGAARFVSRELERYAGAGTLTSISEFFVGAAEALEGMVDRLQKTEALLRSSEVGFVLVTTPEPDRLGQALRLVEEARKERLRVRAVVVNRFLDQESWKHANREARPANLEALTAVGRAMLEGVSSIERRRRAPMAEYLYDYRRHAYEELSRVAEFGSELPEGVHLLMAPELSHRLAPLAMVRQVADYLFGAGWSRPALARAKSESGSIAGVSL